MQRNALVLAKNLSVGEVGNVAAILMGQLAQIASTLFAAQPVLDEDKVRHAGIKYSTVVLKGGSGQIANLAKSLVERPEIQSVVFTATGQSLNKSVCRIRRDDQSKRASRVAAGGDRAFW